VTAFGKKQCLLRVVLRPSLTGHKLTSSVYARTPGGEAPQRDARCERGGTSRYPVLWPNQGLRLLGHQGPSSARRPRLSRRFLLNQANTGRPRSSARLGPKRRSRKWRYTQRQRHGVEQSGIGRRGALPERKRQRPSLFTSGQNKGPGRISTACHDLPTRLCALMERFGTVVGLLRPNTLHPTSYGTTHRALPHRVSAIGVQRNRTRSDSVVGAQPTYASA